MVLFLILSILLCFFNKAADRTVLMFNGGHWSFKILIFTEVGPKGITLILFSPAFK
jgi:hypothetical protein